jgi:hypothetical protein
MGCARALPMIHLMPAVGSCQDPDATPPGVRRPGKNERPHPSRPGMPGTPSIIMSPSSSLVDPDKAGRRHAPPHMAAPRPEHREVPTA